MLQVRERRHHQIKALALTGQFKPKKPDRHSSPDFDGTRKELQPHRAGFLRCHGD